MSDESRKPKRVKWQPESSKGNEGHTEPEPKLNLEPERSSNSENDERLKADKPPHWG